VTDRICAYEGCVNQPPPPRNSGGGPHPRYCLDHRGHWETKPRLARCGHEVGVHRGKQRVACPQCTPPPPVRPVVVECLACGNSFPPLSRKFWASSRQFCSNACRCWIEKQGHPPGSRVMGTCSVCAKRLERAGAKTCSKWCREIAAGCHRRDSYPVLTCALPECSVEFKPRHPSARCCCARHSGVLCNRERRADGREVDVWNDRRRNNYHKRRTKIDATTDHADPVVKADIAERDQWRCHICRKKIRPDRIWPHPYSATLDHVVPLSLGGAHVPENVRLAHFRCNTARGNRGGGEQLLLIG
jgi:hypothetical protein